MSSQTKTAVKGGGAKKPPADPNKKDLIQTIKGPVVDRLKELIPALASYEDVYAAVVQNPDLLYGCLQVFRQRREYFQDLIVDSSGHPVGVDDMPLRCDRTLNEIIGMVVRSGARKFADVRFGRDQALVLHKHEAESLLAKLADLIIGKWGKDEAPKHVVTQGDKFYAAIRDYLEHDWQVPLIPYYAELPVKLILELGRGVTTLRTPEGVSALANIGRKDMDEARRILSDEMMREMLDTEPLAAQGIAFLGKDKYEFLHSAVYEKMGDKFWQMCVDVDRLEAMEDKNAKDLEELANYLHVIGADTINFMLLYLQHWQLVRFLDAATATLGEEKFLSIFGVPGRKSLAKIFCEKCKTFRLDGSDQQADFSRQLPDVFQAYLRAPDGFERGL